jgi:transposase
MLKLYLYGYMNRIRSGRRLEQECQRNIELIWLLGGLCPGYHSITNSCRDNRKTVEKQSGKTGTDHVF